MSLDTLITLLLFVAFVVLPLLSRAGSGRRRGRPPPRGTTTPRRQAPPETGGAPRDVVDAGESGGDRSAAEAFERRLEEARRRVAEATGQAAPEPSPPSATPPPATRSGGLFGTPSGPPPPSFTGLGRPGSYPARLPSASLGREGVREPEGEGVDRYQRVRGAATPRVRPTGGRRQARLSDGRLLSFDKASIVKGIVWRQILDEPHSTKYLRRRLSRLRSR